MFMNIKLERLRRYMSRAALAKALGVPVATLHKWIWRQEAIPVDKLRALSQLFGCPVDYLLKERR